MKFLLIIFLIALQSINSSFPNEKLIEVSDKCDELKFINSEDYPFVVTDSLVRGKLLNYIGGDTIINIYDQNYKLKTKIIFSYYEPVTIVDNKKFYYHKNAVSDFDPWIYIANPEYFNLAIEYLGETEKYYKVITNKKTREVGYIKKQKSFIVLTMKQYFDQNIFGIDFNRKKNPLRKEPSESAEIIFQNPKYEYNIWRADPYAEGEKFEHEDIPDVIYLTGKISQGDWVKVITCANEVGWLRWKNGNKFLIRMYFVC